jgi:hypothetical protein
MDKALVFGTKDCRLESCQGHFAKTACVCVCVCVCVGKGYTGARAAPLFFFPSPPAGLGLGLGGLRLGGLGLGRPVLPPHQDLLGRELYLLQGYGILFKTH